MADQLIKVNVQVRGAGRLHETVCTAEHIETRLSERVWQYATGFNGDREWGERQDDPRWLLGPLVAHDGGWTAVYEHGGAYTFVYDEQHRNSDSSHWPMTDIEWERLKNEPWFRHRSVAVAAQDVVPLIEVVLHYDAISMALALRQPVPYRGAGGAYWNLLDKYVTASKIARNRSEGMVS